MGAGHADAGVSLNSRLDSRRGTLRWQPLHCMLDQPPTAHAIGPGTCRGLPRHVAVLLVPPDGTPTPRLAAEEGFGVCAVLRPVATGVRVHTDTARTLRGVWVCVCRQQLPGERDAVHCCWWPRSRRTRHTGHRFGTYCRTQRNLGAAWGGAMATGTLPKVAVPGLRLHGCQRRAAQAMVCGRVESAVVRQVVGGYCVCVCGMRRARVCLSQRC